MPNAITLSVSSFSFSYDMAVSGMELEDFLKTAVELGYEGVELVSGQIVPGYPYPTDEWVEDTRFLLEKYGLKPCAYGSYVDLTRFTGRDQTDEEVISQLRNDLILAARLGCPVVKTNDQIRVDQLAALREDVERWGVWVGVELHEPNHIRDPLWAPLMQFFREDGAEHFGVVPDTGIFQHRPHEFFRRELVPAVLTEEEYEKIAAAYEAHLSKDQMLLVFGDHPGCRSAIEKLFQTFCPDEIDDLYEILKYSKYMHGKFHYIDPQYRDKGIDFKRIAQIMKEAGFEGAISAEYEGYFRDVSEDTSEQLRRFAVMMKMFLSQ